MMIDSGNSSSRICSSYVTTRSLSDVPGISRVVAPVAMIRLSQEYVAVVPSVAFTSTVCLPSLAPWRVPQPLISVILFFFIKK